ncbi:MAG: hypothetical protein AB7Q17_16480 [Phycisphaerae bacterium]
MGTNHACIALVAGVLCTGAADVMGQRLYHAKYLVHPSPLGGTIRPEHMNNSAQVIAQLTNVAAGGWRHDPDGTWVRVTGLRVNGSGSTSPVWTNDAGQVCGQAENSAGGHEACLWDEQMGAVGCGDFFWSDPRLYNSYARGVNNNGHVCGSASAWDPFMGTAARQAFLWTREAGMVGLGDLPGGPTHSQATGINDHDWIVGTSLVTNYRYEPFLWMPDTGMINLADWEFGKFDASTPFAINNHGEITGTGGPVGGYSDGFIWDFERGFRPLGHLPDTGTHPRDINELGVVVGYSAANGPDIAFIWDETKGIRDLNTLLDEYSRQLPQYRRPYRPLTWAHAINDHGQVLASWSKSNAAILTPFLLADMNDDGAVDAEDIAGFVAALVDREAYAATRTGYWHEGWAADLNQDARIDVRDIDPFLRAIADFSGPKLPAWNCPINLPAHAGDTTHDQNAELPPRARPGSAGE